MKNLTKRMSQWLLSAVLSSVIWACKDDADPSEQESETHVDSATDTSFHSDSDTAVSWDSEGEGDCLFTHSVLMSEVVSTVATVTWSVDPDEVEDARIEFGQDTVYEFSAPADFDGTAYTTMLLGMKPDKLYHYRLTATVEGEICRSRDYTLKTGSLPAGIPMVIMTNPQAEKVEKGFTISAFFSNGNRAFILDQDGYYVWWYTPSGETDDWVRARMSNNGKYMYIANGNVPGPDNGALVRVKMDGTDEKTYDVPRRHHDVLILPDETVVYMEYESDGKGTCDRVMEMDPETGKAVEVFKVRDFFSQLARDGEWCHSNAINYVPSEDAYYMSVLNQDMIVKWTRSSKELEWTFGGPASDFADASWNAQHQFHVLPTGILLFNNQISVFPDPPDGGALTAAPSGGGFFGGTPAHVLEWTMDEEASTASLIWDYSGSLSSYSMGDAKRMPDGNTLITFSTLGVILEIDPEMEPVREINWSSCSVGYANRVRSLYGIQPEYDFYPHR